MAVYSIQCTLIRGEYLITDAVPRRGLLISFPSPSNILDCCHLSTNADLPRCSSFSPRGGVGKPGWGTWRKYASSSSEGYGDRECGTEPGIKRENNDILD